MNINPRTWFAGSKGTSNPVSSSALVRAQMAMGPWQQALGMFIPREVNPWFLEALRESLGILDGAVNRMVTIDGIIDVEGGNDALVQLIQRELIGAIPVGDKNAGLQAFYTGMGQEQYEQGFSLGEMVYDRRGREIVALRVADSKGVLFHRNLDTGVMESWYLPPMPNALGRRDGTDSVQNVLRNSPRQLNVNLIQGRGYEFLNPDTLVYSVFNPENDLPYGVSLFRGIEFVSQILLRMHNATSQAWDRFGDPSFHVNYKTKNRMLKGPTLEARRLEIASNFGTTLNAKRQGNSADFVTAVGADDDIVINIIGGDGKALSIEMPAQQMFEQILAKTGLASWVLGVQLGRAPAGLADNQAEMMLQDSKTRFESRVPALQVLVTNWLRGRGKTWKPGDWQLVQRLPNLRDELKRAQAKFLEAQTQMMLSSAGVPAQNSDPVTIGPQAVEALPRPSKSAIEIAASTFDDPIVRAALLSLVHKQPGHTHAKGAGKEAWAIDDPNLPRIQTAAIAALQSAWKVLANQTLQALELPVTKAQGEVFTFDISSQLQQLTQLQAQFVATSTSADAVLVQLALEIWARGIENAAAGVDREAEAAQVIANARALHAANVETGLRASLQKTTMRVYQDDIVQSLTDGVYNGTNPREVAAQLRKKFDGHDYDFQRLAESEMAAAHAQGNADALKGMGIAQYDWILAPDACPICTKIAEAGPYTVGSGPMPVRDSHPGCFCVINGHVS
ncbi:hypothetical protein EAH75_04255 [Rhodanobacter glycinis]|uniref:hypothetical protein n=1 Tax=Rhodanobacter glycinis TaxID=582702 RepID=UPI00112AF2FF|nr:hypothetical protein [Rhodanobacter glycinis]TPG50657.1 hypothetical protein EAH75_04255 [Rhodanobacter glycinis]